MQHGYESVNPLPRRAICHELASYGLWVVGVDVKPHTDPALADVIVGDLSRIDECLRVVSEAGEVDILVNNAAVLVQEPFETFEMGDYDHLMAVNLRAPFLLAREMGPSMAARGWGRTAIDASGCVLPRSVTSGQDSSVQVVGWGIGIVPNASAAAAKRAAE